MGAWDKSILGNDTSMDFIGDIDDICGRKYENVDDYSGDKVPAMSKELLENNQLEILDYFKSKDVNIFAFQVLATLMVEYGAIFEKNILDICISSLERDVWMLEDFERSYNIKYLLNILKNYKNIPTEYEDDKTNIYNKDFDINYMVDVFKKSDIQNVVDVKIGKLNKYVYCLVLTINENFDLYDYIGNEPFCIQIVYINE
jgi:hypothetical protein